MRTVRNTGNPKPARKRKFIGNLVLRNAVLPDGEICCEGGRIERVGPRYPGDDSGYEVFDFSGFYISPGFIDVHQHGGGGFDYMDGPREAFLGAAVLHAKHGTTTVFPTTLTCPDEELFEVFRLFRSVRKEDYPGADLYGIHLEGPYFADSQKGAQDPKYLKVPEKSHYRSVLNAAEGCVVRWTVAPELPGAMELGDELRKVGIRVSMGHSDADIRVAKEAMAHGYTHLTHFYSGMSTITRKDGYRIPGLVEAGYLFKDLTVEIIADGKHLPAELLQLVYQSKGADRTVLVTDAMRGAGQTEGKTILGSLKNGQVCWIEDGVAKMPDRKAFAGSVATGDRLVRNMVRLTDAGLCKSVRMMTETPARLFGLRDRGRLTPGRKADLAIFDSEIQIEATVCGGAVVYRRGTDDAESRFSVSDR
ncbi:MAG: N-acetylglucosamine-6-phosphate deacetylase [Clostridia bacterium]|nr:N-acetylglucosamine-6-phosphate deacetylase [Clostridia bacterium]